MRIVLDATGVQADSGGMTTFLRGLLDGWSQVTETDAIFVLGMPELPPLATGDSGVVQQVSQVKQSGLIARIRAQQFDLPRLTERVRPDALLTADPSIPLRPIGCPIVAVVHDLRHLARPEEFSHARRKYRAFVWGYGIRHADRLIVDSDATAADVQKYYPTVVDRIRQVRLGADHVDTWPRGAPDHENHAITFGHWSNKRPDFSIRVWGAAYRTHPDLGITLEVVGVPDAERPGLLQIARAEGVEQYVRLRSFVPDQDYQALFASSSLVLMTSTLEGFGLPVVEAMQLGIPVIASSGVGMETAGGDAALYADANSVDSFAKQVVRVLRDDDERARVVARGREQARTFNWSDAAASVRTVLEEAIQVHQR